MRAPHTHKQPWRLPSPPPSFLHRISEDRNFLKSLIQVMCHLVHNTINEILREIITVVNFIKREKRLFFSRDADFFGFQTQGDRSNDRTRQKINCEKFSPVYLVRQWNLQNYNTRKIFVRNTYKTKNELVDVPPLWGKVQNTCSEQWDQNLA